MLAERPWEGLPPEVAPAMRPGLGVLAEEIIETIRATVPAYARARSPSACARASRARCRSSPTSSKRATPGRCRRASCTPTSAAARRARAAASRRCWPPTGSARAWRGGARPSGRPLAAATPAQRERLLETLGAWLLHHGSVPDVARAIHVHPQTVRYRLARLRALLDLDDPETRFELLLITRTRSRPRVVAPMSKTAALQPVPSSA